MCIRAEGVERDKGATPEERRRRAEVRLKAWAWKKHTSNPEALLKLNRPLDWPVIEDDTGIDMRLGAARIQLQRRMLQSDKPEARGAYVQALELLTRVGALREEAINSVDWEAFYEGCKQRAYHDLDDVFNSARAAAEAALEQESRGKEYGLFLCVVDEHSCSFIFPNFDLHPAAQIFAYRQLETWLHKMAHR